MLRIITGDENDPSNREIRVRHFRQPARGFPARHRIAQRPGRSRQMSLRTEGAPYPRAVIGIIASTAPPNVSLLVRRRREGKVCAGRAGNFAAGGQLRSAAEQRSARNLRSPTRAPNCRRRNARVEPEPGSSPASGYRRRSPARSARRTTSAPTRAMPAPSRSVVAARWLELAGVSYAGRSAPSTDIPQPNAPAKPSTAAPVTSKAAPPAAVAPLPLAAADTSLTEEPSGSVQMLLIAILGALALAGLLASAIFRFGGRTADQPSRRRGGRVQLGFGQDRSSIATG